MENETLLPMDNNNLQNICLLEMHYRLLIRNILEAYSDIDSSYNASFGCCMSQ